MAARRGGRRWRAVAAGGRRPPGRGRSGHLARRGRPATRGRGSGGWRGRGHDGRSGARRSRKGRRRRGIRRVSAALHVHHGGARRRRCRRCVARGVGQQVEQVTGSEAQLLHVLRRCAGDRSALVEGERRSCFSYASALGRLRREGGGVVTRGRMA